MRFKKMGAAALLGVFLIAPQVSYAAELEVSGWVPYWSGAKGARDAERHIDVFDEIHPFSHTVKKDGTLSDLADLKKKHWQNLIKDARKEDVLVTPTVMTSDGPMLHAILSNPQSRTAHVTAIIDMMKKGRHDGINIDYEAKRAETKDYFSLFLKELKIAMGNKRLSCAIEPRTPPDSLYRTVPAVLEYSNDLVAIGMYCDRVEIMAYDQQRADIKLNDARRGAPYFPVSDSEWVRKVVEHTALSIPKEKLLLGIPTYGYEHEVKVSPQWFESYTRIRAINPPDALKLAKKNKITPTRNSAGEMGFSYATKFTAPRLATYDIPRDTPKGNKVAAHALAYANTTGQTTYFNLISWSDADAIRAKVELAQELGLAGVAIFKIDGEEDKGLWDILEDV